MMERSFSLLFLATLMLCILPWSSPPLAQSSGGAGSTLKLGDLSPAFSLPTSIGSTIALKDYAGKSTVVLVFYRGYW